MGVAGRLTGGREPQRNVNTICGSDSQVGVALAGPRKVKPKGKLYCKPVQGMVNWVRQTSTRKEA